MTYYYGLDAAGRWRWRLEGADGRVIAISARAYADEEECVDAIVLVRSSRDAAMKKVDID
jgi:uncharacterized protein YegP (UPF0339 family)